jgi:deazaflavin-dependent oxidoreductase (nitroreductase family)
VPLRHVDPHRKPSALASALNKVARTRFGAVMARYAARTDPWLGRISDGKVSWGMFNVPSATLTTTGAKSGRPREVQLAYFHDGPDAIVLASNYGGDRHPQWYHNLIAHPDCDLGGEPFLAAEVSDPGEYDRLFGIAEAYFGGFSDYREKTARVGRKIPVFRLTPTDH